MFTALSFDLQTTCTGDEARCSPFTYDIVIINNGKHCLLSPRSTSKTGCFSQNCKCAFHFCKTNKCTIAHI